MASKKRKKGLGWTMEELNGQVLISCTVSKTGLDPLIDEDKSFDTLADAISHYVDRLKSYTRDEGIFITWTTTDPKKIEISLNFRANRKLCGSGTIEVLEVK